MSTVSWKNTLSDRIAPELGNEIDLFETQIDLKKQGKIDDKVFAETRLRRGAYGQRYDNGQRHDGNKNQFITFPHQNLSKGPDTLLEAPGMQRIKIPYGALNSEQMELLADLVEEYSDGIIHISTRQEVQLHYVALEDTPDMHRRLAAVGITTREACGNSVRNVTACPLSGICHDEAFDTSQAAQATANYLLGHRDVQDFGRKIKVAFSGCQQHACGLTSLHDIGAIARINHDGDTPVRGFSLSIGGGLGAIPYHAKQLMEFLPEAELLPWCQAICRVFARLGEKKNRGRARLKFMVARLGIDEVKKLIQEERDGLPDDPRWTAWLKEDEPSDACLHAGSDIQQWAGDVAFQSWAETNLYRQRQQGFFAATIALPLGDMTALQMRRLADVCRQYTGSQLRCTVEQNLLLRWLPAELVPALYADLKAIGLAEAGAGTLVDISACPGTDTCKLGIASSRGLAAELRKRLSGKMMEFDASVRGLRIKISGCFNSCAQHHAADIGFYGVSRTIGSYKVPHFQLVLGGQWSENIEHYGKSLAVVPSKRIPEAVERLLAFYLSQRTGNEAFSAFIARHSKRDIKQLFKDLSTVPSHDSDSSLYTDWGDSREFSIGDIGVGECAGELVSLGDFGIAEAEATLFDAQEMMEQENNESGWRASGEKSLRAMTLAAQGLIKLNNPDISDDPSIIVDDFRQHFCDTERFYDPYAGGKFAQYYLHAWERRDEDLNQERAERRLGEAELFIEAAHACHSRMMEQKS